MICRPACCLALASSCWASLIAQDAVPPSAPVAPPRPAVRIVDLSGSPKERGEVHGRVLKDEIQRLVRAWKAGLRQSQGVEPDEFIKRFIAGTRFTAAIDKWTPGLLDEVRGIAAGSGIDFDTLYVFNLMDEVWAQGRQVVAHKCTAIGVDARDRQPTIVAQNLDLPVVFHGTQTVLRITAGSGLQTLVVTVPGLVGANGINSARVAVAVNTLLQLRPRPDGLPVAFVVRGLLAQESWAAARKFLYTVDHASGQSYTLGGPDVAHNFECSAGRVERCQPIVDALHTWHTNHPIANEDWSPVFRELANARGLTPQRALAPCPRFEELTRRLPAGKSVGLEAVLTALASREATVPICNAQTFACTVMLLGRTPELRVSGGPSATHACQTLRLAPSRPPEPSRAPAGSNASGAKGGGGATGSVLPTTSRPAPAPAVGGKSGVEPVPPSRR